MQIVLSTAYFLKLLSKELHLTTSRWYLRGRFVDHGNWWCTPVYTLPNGRKWIHSAGYAWLHTSTTPDSCKASKWYCFFNRRTLCVSTVFAVARCLSVRLSVTFVYCIHCRRQIQLWCWQYAPYKCLYYYYYYYLSTFSSDTPLSTLKIWSKSVNNLELSGSLSNRHRHKQTNCIHCVTFSTV